MDFQAGEAELAVGEILCVVGHDGFGVFGEGEFDEMVVGCQIGNRGETSLARPAAGRGSYV